MASSNRGEAVPKQIQQDWVNREYIEIITISIKKITDFLNSFDLSCRSKLAGLNEKLTILERKIDYLEACVTKDTDRKNKFGPDRTCAEWILRNGGSVKFVNFKENSTNYNELPPEGTVVRVKEVDASNTSIMHTGFEHFNGCKNIDTLILHKCAYVDDKALALLFYLKDSLSKLQVSCCPNVTDNGLISLANLTKLSTLNLCELQSVKKMDETRKILKMKIPNCNIKCTS